MNKLLAIFASLLLLLAGLSGCGGGGGGSSPSTTPTTTQFPIAGAISAYFQAGHSFTLSGTSGANTISFQVNYASGTTSIFQGQPASTMTQTAVISVNGGAGSTVSGVAYFNASPYQNLGYISSDGRYQVYANQQTLPTYATVGQSGQLDTYITYTTNTKAVVYATGTETWSLLADTATTAWACNNDTHTVVGSAPAVITNCFKIDTTGNVLSKTVTMPINGTVVTFK